MELSSPRNRNVISACLPMPATPLHVVHALTCPGTRPGSGCTEHSVQDLSNVGQLSKGTSCVHVLYVLAIHTSNSHVGVDPQCRTFNIFFSICSDNREETLPRSCSEGELSSLSCVCGLC